MPNNYRTSTRQSLPPTPVDVEQTYSRAQKQIEIAFASFHSLLQDKTLPENKSEANKKNERYIVTTLTKAAAAMDMINVGDGVTAISIIALREHLQVRDRVNELELELTKTRLEITKLKKALGVDEK